MLFSNLTIFSVRAEFISRASKDCFFPLLSNAWPLINCIIHKLFMSMPTPISRKKLIFPKFNVDTVCHKDISLTLNNMFAPARYNTKKIKISNSNISNRVKKQIKSICYAKMMTTIITKNEKLPNYQMSKFT